MNRTIINFRAALAARVEVDTLQDEAISSLQGEVTRLDTELDTVTGVNLTGLLADVDAGGLDIQDEPDTAGPPPLWETRTLGDKGTLNAVCAVSANEAYAVGDTRVLRYNGATWSWICWPSKAP